MAPWQYMLIDLLSVTFVSFTLETVAKIILIKEWNRCPTSESKIELFRGVSVHTCSKTCDVTSDCLSYNYFPRGKFCELLANDKWIVGRRQSQGPCHHGEHSRIQSMHETDGATNVRACRKAVVANAIVSGNIHTVGSRIKVECHAEYRTVNDTLPIVCGEDRNWTNIPNCNINCGEPPTVPNTVIEAMITKETAERYCNCNEGFCTPMNTTYVIVQCKSNGNWTSPSSRCIENTETQNGANSFVFGFMKTRYTQYRRRVYIVVSHPTKIIFSIPLMQYQKEITVSNGTEVSLPKDLFEPEKTGHYPFGILLQSNAPIEVYIETSDDSSDGSVLIPEKYLSTNYMLISWNDDTLVKYKSQFAIVGTVDDTEVVISFQNGSLLFLNVNRCQLYHYQTTLELTGTVVMASENIAVFAGHEYNYAFKDHLFEQMPPVGSLRTEYIVSYPYPRYNYAVRIAATEDNTEIELSNGESLNLNHTEYSQHYFNNEPISISASRRILVAVFSLKLYHTHTPKWGNVFDGSMLIVPGLTQFKPEYNIFVPRSVVKCVLMVTYPSYLSSIQNIRLNHGPFSVNNSVKVTVKQRGTYTVLYTELSKGLSVIYTTDGTPFGAYISFFRSNTESWFSLPYRF